MPKRLYFQEDYYTETIKDFNLTLWREYGESKLGWNGDNLILVGVRNYPSSIYNKPEMANTTNINGENKMLTTDDKKRISANYTTMLKWHKPRTFLYGKKCKVYIQQAMKDGFVELRFSYTSFTKIIY